MGCCTIRLHWTAVDHLKIMCRLVEGVTLNSPLSELCPPGIAQALTIHQYEQQVLEVAVQLVDVSHAANSLFLIVEPCILLMRC